MPKTKEQCEEIRERMKERIIEGAIICFAQNGYVGTKISDLARHIGIGQGTLYSYFSSKEELFEAIINKLNKENEMGFINIVQAPMDAESKIKMISESMIKEINDKTITTYSFVLNLRMVEEGTMNNPFTKSYESAPVKGLGEIILQGQKEGSVIEGDVLALADYYWSVVHTLAFMNIYNEQGQTVQATWLERILLRDM